MEPVERESTTADGGIVKIGALVALLMLCSAPSLAVADSGAATPSDAPSLMWLVGSWSCSTGNGASGTAKYTTDASGNIHGHIEWSRGGPVPFADEVYIFNTDNGTWRLREDMPNGTMSLHAASGFDGDAIDFVTSWTSPDGSPVSEKDRIKFADSQHFTHVWSLQRNGVWSLSSFAECRQTTPAEAR